MRKFEDKYLIKKNFNFDASEVYITPTVIKKSIQHMYNTLDIIDNTLIQKNVEKLSLLVERANLSSIVGNLLGAGYANASNSNYFRNRPNTYPDLVPTGDLQGIEIKTALVKNYPKGHLPKEGYYLTYRYCLTDSNGQLVSNDGYAGDTVTIWEVKFGYLEANDFSVSNTDGDSGKTAVIKSEKFNKMSLLYLDKTVNPYKRYPGCI